VAKHTKQLTSSIVQDTIFKIISGYNVLLALICSF